METKFTKGKWKLLIHSNAIVDNKGGLIAEVSCYTQLNDEVRANAKLIAAAPELLKACEQMASILRLSNTQNDYKEYYELLESAIKKATE